MCVDIISVDTHFVCELDSFSLTSVTVAAIASLVKTKHCANKEGNGSVFHKSPNARSEADASVIIRCGLAQVAAERPADIRD